MNSRRGGGHCREKSNKGYGRKDTGKVSIKRLAIILKRKKRSRERPWNGWGI